MNILNDTKKFSFLYDGKDFDKLVITKSISEKGNTLTTTYTLPDGLKVTNEMKQYPDFDGYEWVTWFENTGTSPSKIISDILDCDFSFKLKKDPEFDWANPANAEYDKVLRVYTPIGSNGTEKDFMVNMDIKDHGKCFYQLFNHDEYYYKPFGGRSSNGESAHLYDFDTRKVCSDGNAPFFNLYKEDKGIIFAIGWSGQWNCRLYRDDEFVNVQTKIEDSNFRLMPGEKIRTSSFVVMSYDCDYLESQNKWRSFVKKHFSIIGKPGRDKSGPFTLSRWGGWSTERMLKTIDIVKKYKLPFDYLWVDAGWFGASSAASEHDDGSWSAHVGDWNANTKIHPDSLKEVSAAAKDAGMKFLLWFESERVVKTAPIVKEHPEYLLPFPDNSGNYLLNLGDDDAFLYCFKTLCERIDELNIKCVRQDFNIDPLNAWRLNDPEDRRGITEIKYINGLYRLWDMLLLKYPDLIIDNCASGGRRIDIETLRRSIPLWRSDYYCNALFNVNVNQVHTHSYASWFPYVGTGAGRDCEDIYRFRSGYSSAMVMGCYFEQDGQIISEKSIERIKNHCEEYLRVRPFFSEDFYPLSQSSTKNDVWCGSQFNRKENHDGIIQVFKREKSSYITATYKLYGLKCEKQYNVVDADDNFSKVYSGKELMEHGIEITIKQCRTAKLYFYAVLDE